MESKPATPATPKEEKLAARPQSRNFKAEREARAKEGGTTQGKNKGNNRDQQQNGNRQRTITVMVGNPVKGTVTIVVLTTKGRNHKARNQVEMIIVKQTIIVKQAG